MNHPNSFLHYAVSLITSIVVSALAGCAPPLALVALPENYQRQIAERPVLERGEYWAYERANLTRVKSTTLAPNLGFPLWIGKTWSFPGEALVIGRNAPTSKAPRIPTETNCQVVALEEITVTAGTFAAFRCQCECAVTGQPERGCGVSTLWYSPEVKNVIKRKTESNATSLELVEHKVSGQKRDATVAGQR